VTGDRDATCPVCAEELQAPNLANCYACRRDFHLQMRMDVAGKDCGEVWLHEEGLFLVFGCNECLAAGLFGTERVPSAGHSI
jgi:hypothetical protein